MAERLLEHPNLLVLGPTDVVTRFYAAFPNEDPDPFMTEHVQRIISAAAAL